VTRIGPPSEQLAESAIPQRPGAPLWGSLVAAATLVSATASADRPRPTYVQADPALVDHVDPAALAGGRPNIIYLNGCFEPGDCTFTPGGEDSVSNRSSIIPRTSTLTPFEAGSTAWAAVVDCVAKAYRPFNIVITDQDPSPAPHFEAVVAGTPDEVGFPDNIGGVAPFDCGVIDNAVTYSFANLYGGSVPDICWTVAQESAHAFGLDHEFLCEDPLTYLTECGSQKWFRNVDAQCGELQARECMCPGSRQNSFASIRSLFGPGVDTPPTVAIAEPADGASVSKGFAVTATASDDVEIDRVELWINGQKIATAAEAPYRFAVPATLTDGVQQIQARAYDLYDSLATAEIEVTQGEPCRSAEQCPSDQTCVDGRCVLGPGSPGGLGETCSRNEDCWSGLCGDDGSEKFCAERCDRGEGGCPDGFGCREAGDQGVCWPGYDDSSGCRTTGGGRGSLAAIALGLVAALYAMRRRRK
jgi:MYXO-CTERM domain-containing protein